MIEINSQQINNVIVNNNNIQINKICVRNNDKITTVWERNLLTPNITIIEQDLSNGMFTANSPKININFSPDSGYSDTWVTATITVDVQYGRGNSGINNVVSVYVEALEGIIESIEFKDPNSYSIVTSKKTISITDTIENFLNYYRIIVETDII